MISDKELEIIIDQCDHGIPRGKTGLREFAMNCSRQAYTAMA